MLDFEDCDYKIAPDVNLPARSIARNGWCPLSFESGAKADMLTSRRWANSAGCKYAIFSQHRNLRVANLCLWLSQRDDAGTACAHANHGHAKNSRVNQFARVTEFGRYARALNDKDSAFGDTVPMADLDGASSRLVGCSIKNSSQMSGSGQNAEKPA